MGSNSLYSVIFYRCVTLLCSKGIGKNGLIGSVAEHFIMATNNIYTKILILARVKIPNIEDLR